MKTIAHVSYSGITPQCKAMLDRLVEADKAAINIAGGEYESYSSEGLNAIAEDAFDAGEAWLKHVIGDDGFAAIDIQYPMSVLAVARDRLEENDRPVSRAQAKIEHRIMQYREGV